ncbi:hypothetical protein HQ531_05970, partial [bacterium]|nr:hypothetical protein [bacterium]
MLKNINPHELLSRVYHFIIISILCPGFFHVSFASAQIKAESKQSQIRNVEKISDMMDRARATHDASNIGLFFENTGRLHPYSRTFGPSGEFPINSGRNYISSFGPFVGVAPDAASGRPANTIQGLWIHNEEWEAVGGYHNPASTDIAMSDAPSTWPDLGWYVQDEEDEPIIYSSQDSYCVYNDKNNTVETLGIQIAQTGYAYGLSYAEDLLFFSFEMTNESLVSYDSVYFGFFIDIDVGSVPGGAVEYDDDLVGFDEEQNFITFYDSDTYSSNWGGATGIMGVAYLETPLINGETAGITDMHFNIWDDNSDDDSLQIAQLSSNQEYLPANYSADNYFHGANPHIDDVTTIDPAGNDYTANFSSGPFDLAPDDTLIFIISLVAGVDEVDIYKNLEVAQDLHADDFIAPKPPPSPSLSGIASDNKITLFWTDEIEDEPDALSGILDFEGYNIYRSLDQGLSWDQIDRNHFPETGTDAVPLMSFDRVNGIGDDQGISYTFTDETVINGFDYWYSLTAFDHGDTLIE